MVSKIWHDPPEITVQNSLHDAIGGHPLVARVLIQRGFNTPDQARAYLQPEYYTPTSGEALPDLTQAVQTLVTAVSAKKKVLVWGDFDVDGQTATALLMNALEDIGIPADFYIPNRLRESHGIRVNSLEKQLKITDPAILLTCDTGVSAHEAISYAKSCGVTTLITDHHDLPRTLPDADAIVNPKRLDRAHPLASLPGVGVVYKLIECLYTELGRVDELAQFLDLVALGIVADVAEQTHDTRYLLQLGLEHLRHTQRIGLNMLLDVAGLTADQLTAGDIGFQIGPRLNAAGRLEDARPAVELLTTHDTTRARLLAVQLEGLNNQRRLESRQIYAAAQEQIMRDPSLLDWEALVLASPTWHSGIVGIVASRLAEHYQRPVVLLNTADNTAARGSARSVPGYDIGAAISAQADLLLEYGGHPGAAGLSLHPDNIPIFRRRLSNTLHETRDPDVRPGLNIDAYVTLKDVTLDLARELNRLAPFGEGNPRIVLATTDLQLKSAAYIGRTREHRRLIAEDINGTRRDIVWWNSADQSLPEGLFDLAYEIDINTYREEPELQLVLVDYRRSAATPVTVDIPRREIEDHRYSPAPLQVLSQMLDHYPEAAVWAEGYRRSESPGFALAELPESNVLIIYTAPSGPQPLQEALERVKPVKAVLVATDPPIQTLPDVQRRILEIIKYVLNQQNGKTTLDALTGAVAQSTATIRHLLDYYAAKGEITVEYKRGTTVMVTYTNTSPAPDLAEKLSTLHAGFVETAAYRAFFKRADPYQLLGWEKP